MAFKSRKISISQSSFRGNSGLLDVFILDSERDSQKDLEGLLQVPLEWQKGSSGNSVGKVEKDCSSKRSWRLGSQGYLFIFKSPGS